MLNYIAYVYGLTLYLVVLYLAKTIFIDRQLSNNTKYRMKLSCHCGIFQ